MSRTIALCAAASVLAYATTASAQATTVQLPTFSFFTVNTTVLVPDGGSAYMGGIGRAASGSTSRGIPGLGGRPFANTATAGSTSAGGISVSAQIHDMEAMDQALLNQGVASRPDAAQLFAARKAAGVARNAAPQSLADIRQEQAAAAQATSDEAREYYDKGNVAYENGKFGVAKIYWQMSVRRADGELLQLAQAKLKAVTEQTRSPQLTAQRER